MCQSHLQMAVEDEQVMANVHITPMRASRALALRYLATKFGTNMENIVVRYQKNIPLLLQLRQRKKWVRPTSPCWHARDGIQQGQSALLNLERE